MMQSLEVLEREVKKYYADLRGVVMHFQIVRDHEIERFSMNVESDLRPVSNWWTTASEPRRSYSRNFWLRHLVFKAAIGSGKEYRRFLDLREGNRILKRLVKIGVFKEIPSVFSKRFRQSGPWVIVDDQCGTQSGGISDRIYLADRAGAECISLCFF